MQRPATGRAREMVWNDHVRSLLIRSLRVRQLHVRQLHQTLYIRSLHLCPLLIRSRHVCPLLIRSLHVRPLQIRSFHVCVLHVRSLGQETDLAVLAVIHSTMRMMNSQDQTHTKRAARRLHRRAIHRSLRARRTFLMQRKRSGKCATYFGCKGTTRTNSNPRGSSGCRRSRLAALHRPSRTTAQALHPQHQWPALGRAT